MKNGIAIHKHWHKWISIFGFITLLAAFFASQTYISYAHYGNPITWIQALTGALVNWYPWGILLPFIFWISRCFRIGQRNWLYTVPIHFIASIIFSLLKLVIHIFMAYMMGWTASNFSFTELFQNYFIGRFHNYFLTYWVILSISHTLDYYRRYKEGELRTSQIKTKLAEAQLQTLKMHLQPHFLFNTFHAISTLMHRDTEAANRMLTYLSDLLRFTLDNIGIQKILLKQELEFLQRYLKIEETRFQDRLTVKMKIDPETLDAQVPNLILQPIVGIAIQRSVTSRLNSGKIEIRANRKDEILQLEVRNTYNDLLTSESTNFKNDEDLTDTQIRLKQIYGRKYRFEVYYTPQGGFKAALSIPFITKLKKGKRMENEMKKKFQIQVNH